MMAFNPELQRNVWLQMSWSRLLVAPLLIGKDADRDHGPVTIGWSSWTG